MAIQFNCPYCTTQIRVPDSAGGKRGTCPRCRARILVPKVAVQDGCTATDPSRVAVQTPQPAAAQPVPPSGPQSGTTRETKKSLRERLAEQPQFSGFAEDVAPAPGAGRSEAEEAPDAAPAVSPAPPLPVTAAIPAASREAATPFARALKRRRQRRRLVWIPVAFGLLLVGGAAVFLILTGRKKLEGTLEAVIVPEATLQPRTIGDSSVSVDKEKVAKVLKHLQQEPLGLLRSDLGLMKHEVNATSSGLSVTVYDTDRVQFYRVDVRHNKTLRDFLKENARKLDLPREKELEAGLKEFYELSADAVAAGGSIPKDALEVLRSRVIVNSLVGAAGYNLLASVGGQLYLCMYEDDRGRLYYLLPRGTKKFAIVGRKLADGTRLFPGKYSVDVQGTLERKPPKTAEVPEPEKSAPAKSEPAKKKPR